MPARQQWSDEYWKRLDKETGHKLRTTCPKCGSAKTYYNEKLKLWRCGKCENAFKVEGVRAGKHWWQKLFKKD
jgi:ribosomal protein L37AE/L43A